MTDITRLTQLQTSYTGVSSSVDTHQPTTPRQDAKASLPEDQVVQTNATQTVRQAPSPEAQRIDIFVVRDNVFSLYKLPNGELFSKVRNLKTGEEKVFPSIDSLRYFEAIQGNRGLFIEKGV